MASARRLTHNLCKITLNSYKKLSKLLEPPLINGATFTECAPLGIVTDLNWKIAGAGDFNNDGQPDILWRNSSTGEIYVWYMNGVTFTECVPLGLVTDPNWKIVAIDDYNGDGQMDILWRHSLNSINYVWYMHGSTFFGSGEVEAMPGANWLMFDKD